MRRFYLSALWASACLAAPIVEDGLVFHSLEARQQNLPTIKFPYGTWQASKYDAANDLYMFHNIRFAAPPVGNLRFAKPAPPDPIDGIQTGAVGGTCPQSVPKGLLGSILGAFVGDAIASSALGSSVISYIENYIGTIDIGKLQGGDPSQEDCLFLDLYVPGKALKGEAKLPIVNWLYGGAYIMGAKGAIYTGDGIIKAAGGNAIFVSGNYRLGALGFMAGTTMEKEGAPNAGLWDQRAVLEWIQKYASLFGGDANDVSVWGESAGGGSIMHHLTAFGGKQPALFKKAVLESPAYDARYDRKGSLEKTFQDFAAAAGCAGKGLTCLRALDSKAISAAQDKYVGSLPAGKFGFGPAADGNLVRQHPILELSSGNFAKDVESLVVSHVAEEAAMFTRNNIKDDAGFLNLVEYHFGKNAAVNDAVMNKFPINKFATQKQRTHDFVQFSVFTCHTRFISEAYKGKSYNVQYSRGGGLHGTDIVPTFYNAGASTSASGFGGASAKLPQQYQSYLASHARSGDVNKYRADGTIEWPIVEIGPAMSKVLNVTDNGFDLIQDQMNKADDCYFWRDTFAALTNFGGYAPPGAVVQSNLFMNSSSSPSANFQ